MSQKSLETTLSRYRVIGSKTKRKEDFRLLTGMAKFVDDLRFPQTFFAKFVRSAYPHARIEKMNLDSLRNKEGILHVFTGKDIARLVKPIETSAPLWKPLKFYPLATDKARYVGEAIAVIVARDIEMAEDAVEKVGVDYKPLPAVLDVEQALEPDAPLLFKEWGTNCMGTERFETGNISKAFEEARYTFKERLKSHRYTAVPIETRGCLSSFDRGTGQLTLYTSTQWPHLLRSVLSQSLSYPENKIRVIAPEVGGGFGVKNHFYPEEITLAVLALHTGYTIKWIEERREHLVATNHAREQVHDIEIAIEKSGIILGIRDRVLGDVGAATLAPYNGIGPVRVAAFVVPGAYKVRNYECQATCVVTNKTPAGAYRGFGQPEGEFAIERILSIAASELKLDPLEFRLKNLVKQQDLPYVTATGNPLDTGSFSEALELASKMIGYPEFRQKQYLARQHGTYIGISVIPFIEGTAPTLFGQIGMSGGYDSATVRIEPDGNVSVFTGICSTGSGLETALAQVAAESLYVPLDSVLVHQGDTDSTPFGLGSWGSRSLVVAGGSIVLAAQKLSKKILNLASKMIGIPESELYLEEGFVKAVNNKTSPMPLRELARVAYLDSSKLPADVEPTLESTSHFDPSLTSGAEGQSGSRTRWVATVSNGALGIVVEVDPLVGSVRILNCVMVDDCGRVVNPDIVEGQLHGGVAQGIGGALYEELLYDDNGQLASASLVDYLLPGALQIPEIKTAHIESPSLNVPLGFKGVGEAGVICPPAAIANAVEDALGPFGIRVLESHLKPEYVWNLVKQSKTGLSKVESAKKLSSS